MVWEVEHLSSNHRAKTIDLIPPTKYYFEDALAAEQHWQETQATFRQRGIHLPAYTVDGAFFMLDERGRVSLSRPFKPGVSGTGLLDLVKEIGESPRGGALL